MLACPDHSLPAELYSLIFSYLDRRDVVQLSRTCRTLFNASIRDIWRVVQLRALLALLPGSCMVVNSSGGHSEPKAPTFGMTSECYYARFSFYAPYVEVLKTEPWPYSCIPSNYFTDRVNYRSLHRIELPALKEVDMGYMWSGSGWVLGGAYDKPSLFWMALLIPPTLKRLSFTATGQWDLSSLGTFLARCPQLTRFRLRFDQRPSWDTWLSISAFQIPQEVTDLEIYCAEVSNAGFLWLSKLPKLQSLELLLCQRFSPSPRDMLVNTSFNPSITYPHAFSTLRNLCTTVTGRDKLQQVIQIWRTIAAHVTHFTIKAPERLWTPGTFDELFVGFTSHCSKATFLHFQTPRIPSYGLNILPLPVSQLSLLKSLQLRVLRIGFLLDLVDDGNPLKSVGTLFPYLEELWLDKTPIRMDELLQATIYFPHIRHLKLSLHTLKPTSKLLSDSLRRDSQHVDGDHVPGSILNLKLDIYTGKGLEGDHWAYNAEDWDFAARLLASRWSYVSIETSLGTEFLDICRKANEKFAFYST